MLKQIEGSLGVAEAVALCRPEIICAYPISPQTHIVENLGAMVKKGSLEDCEFLNVESEFAAMSVAIGGSVAGGRAYTATASQGLLYMAEFSSLPKTTRKPLTSISRLSRSPKSFLFRSWSVWTVSS